MDNQNSTNHKETSAAYFASQGQEPDTVIQDWRSDVLNVLLPIVSVTIFPAVVQTVVQVFTKSGVAWQGAAIFVIFYLVLIYITIRRDISSIKRGQILVVLAYLTGVASMARGGLAGDGTTYLIILPILAITLINPRAGIYAGVLSIITYMFFGVLAHNGILTQWLIVFDNPLEAEQWLYYGLTMAALITTSVYLVVKFSDFQFQTLKSTQKIAHELEIAYKKLEGANQQLENKVEQRTIELIQANQRLEFLATHDSLTGLPNRILLYDRLDQTIKKSKRGRLEFAIFFVDIDDFKNINDTLGHVVGDETLKIVAERLSQSVRESDTVARLAGDEFVVILDNLRTLDDVEIVSDKIARSLAQPFDFLPDDITVSASIGISLFPKHGDDADGLIQKADSAMYIVKSRGKKNFLIYTQ